MNRVFSAIVMLCGVFLIGWDLYDLYHGLPMSAPAFGAGVVFALVGAAWIQDGTVITIGRDRQ